MYIHLDSPDLMTRVRLESRWRSAGATVTSGANADRPALVVIDLAARNIETVAEWRERCPDARILAFGPHVEGAMLKAAREAGADEVVVRGRVAERVIRRIEDAPPQGSG